MPKPALVAAGHPEVSCTKGMFQRFNVWLTQFAQTQKTLAVSLGRHFEVTDPLLAAGTAEIWSFLVKYAY